MWQYEKKLQYPVRIKTPNAKLAKVIISQLGGPDGELSASLRYLNQRYAMPYGEVKGLRARGGYTVDITWKDGVLQSATITPDFTGKETVRYGDKRKKVSFKAGKPYVFK